MYKYGVIVISYDNEIYRSFDEYRSKLLLTENIPFAVIYNGKKPTWKLRKWEYYILDENMNPAMYNKFIHVTSILLKQPEWANLQYFIRINSSTFLNFRNLSKVFSQLPVTQCYAGRPLETFPYFPAAEPVKFVSPHGVSGMYTFFSKDVLELLIQAGLSTNCTCNDDVTLGTTAYELKIPRTLINDFLININDIPVSTEQYSKALDYTFVRIKNETNRNADLSHWEELYKMYNKKYV